MIATGPAMTLQVRDRDKVMEPHRVRWIAARVTKLGLTKDASAAS